LVPGSFSTSRSGAKVFWFFFSKKNFLTFLAFLFLEAHVPPLAETVCGLCGASARPRFVDHLRPRGGAEPLREHHRERPPANRGISRPSLFPDLPADSRNRLRARLSTHGGGLHRPLGEIRNPRARLDALANSIAWDAGAAPAPPNARHWLGTDDVSRDVLARVLYGLRVSILFGFAVTITASLLGIIAGAVQGFYGGLVDLLGQRFIEIWSGTPQLFLLIVVSSILAPGFGLLVIFLLAFSWMALAGLVRAEFLRARKLDSIRAARALGVPDWQIMLRHMLPNAAVAVLTFMPFLLADSVTLLASLDFLGFGLPPGSASLGELVSQARNNLQAPWLGITVFVALGGLLLLLIFIGEAVRDAFDPRRAP
jgi:microcin C transport system permease protein